jgi:PAP2 superfamily
MKKWLVLFFTLLHLSNKAQNSIVRCNEKLIEVVMEDIFSPPLASRVQAYPNIAAYEVMRHENNSLKSIFSGFKNGYELKAPTTKIDYELGGMLAFCALAKELVYSEYRIVEFKTAEIEKWFSTNKDSALFKQTENYTTEISTAISKYLKQDNYGYTRTLMRYVVVDTPGAWQPTGPDYNNALEPNWGLIRSFYFDSGNQIKVKPNVVYSENKKSKYFSNAKKMHKKSIQLTDEEKLIAQYWDDNPNTLKSSGHLSYFIHKINPLGHWVKIAGQAAQFYKFDAAKTSQVYAFLAVAQYESVLSCWREKYITNAVRPITFIHKFIDPNWSSLIETPPFPEYTSGHSCISGASAEMLTYLIPQPYTFIDSTEMYINLPSRKFNSFQLAASEASISRYYGGIHFLPSLDNGIVQGKNIATYIIKRNFK